MSMNVLFADVGADFGWFEHHLESTWVFRGHFPSVMWIPFTWTWCISSWNIQPSLCCRVWIQPAPRWPGYRYACLWTCMLAFGLSLELLFISSKSSCRLSVVLRSEGSTRFRGFMLDAQNSSSISSSSPVGQFLLLDSDISRLLDCYGSKVSKSTSSVLMRSSMKVSGQGNPFCFPAAGYCGQSKEQSGKVSGEG